MVLGSWQLNTVVTVLFLGTSLALVQRSDQDHFCETGYERSFLLERDNLLGRGSERNANRKSNILDERWENDWRHTGREDVTRDRLLRAEWHSVRKSSSEPGILGYKARFDGLDNPRITDTQRRDSSESLERSADPDLGSKIRGGVRRGENQRHGELRQDNASEELRQKRESRSINRREDHAVEDRRSERFDREQSLLLRRERLMQDQQREGRNSDRLRSTSIDRREDRIHALLVLSTQRLSPAIRMRLADSTERQDERRLFREQRGDDKRESDLVRAEARRGENFKKTDAQEVLRERTDREDAEIRVDSSQRISRDFVERSKVLAEPQVDKERENIRSDQRLLTFDRRVDQQDIPRQRTDLNTRNEDLERSIDCTELRDERNSQTHRTDRRALDRTSNREREDIARSNQRRENSLERLDRRNERRFAIREEFFKVDRRYDSVLREHSDRLDSMPLSNKRFEDFAQFVDRRVDSQHSADRAITAHRSADSQEISGRYNSRENRDRFHEGLLERREERKGVSVRAIRNALDRLSNERHEDLVRTEDLRQQVDRKDVKRVIPRANAVQADRREYSQEEGTELAGREGYIRIISRDIRERFDESAERIREDVHGVRREQPDSREQVNQRISRDRSGDEGRVVNDRQQEKRRIIVELSREREFDQFEERAQLQQSRITLEARQSRVDSSRQTVLNLREQSDNQAARREVTNREVVRENQRGRSSDRFSNQKREDTIRTEFTEDQRENSKGRVNRERKNREGIYDSANGIEGRFRIAIRNSDRAGDHTEMDNSRPIRLDNSREQREKISREFDHQEIRAISLANRREDARRLDASVRNHLTQCDVERQSFEPADRYIEVEMLNHLDASTGEGHREYSATRKLSLGRVIRSIIPVEHQEFTEKLELSINGVEQEYREKQRDRFERLNTRDERYDDSRNQLDRETRQERTDRDHTRESPRQFAPILKKAQTERHEHEQAHMDTLIRNTDRTSARRDGNVDDSMDYIRSFAQPNILTVIQATLLVVVFMKTLNNTKFGNGVFFKLMELSGMIES